MTAAHLGFRRSYTWLALALMWATPFTDGAAAQSATPECHEPQACRELALEARTRGAYETFHDLAWRAVQTGRPNDPELMYLLARAQALSGRRRDAVIMLRRLAEAGHVNDAATDEDFRRVRELSDWRYVETLSSRPRPVAAEPASAAVIAKPPATTATKPPPPTEPPAATAVEPPPRRVVTPPAPAAAAAPPPAPAVTPRATPVAPPAAVAVKNALRVVPAKAEEAARFSTRAFVPGGVAYDAVSRRLLFGDVTGRRLFVVGEGSDRSVDLVRADSAGFDDVTAIAINPARGDLWVASTAANGSGGALHRLQLISGRSLTKLPVPGQGPARLIDLAVTGDGTILILDSATPRLFVHRPGGTAVELLMPLMTPQPVSITVSDDGRVVYAAHQEGISRIDLASRRASALTAPKSIVLGQFGFIRWHRDALVGSQVQPDGSRGLVKLKLNRDGRAVTEATLIGGPSSAEGDATAATISNGDLYYLMAVRPESQSAGSESTDVQVQRIKLP